MKGICGADCDNCQMSTLCKGCKATRGRPFGGPCVLCENCDIEKDDVCKIIEEYKKQLIKEINSLKVDNMPMIKDLFALPGSFVNMEYCLDNGEKIKLLKDENIYLGTQVEIEGSNKCYGIACDNLYILICEYEENGVDPKIVIYKRR